MQELIYYVRVVKKCTKKHYLKLDAHSSHMCWEALELLEENNIIVLFIPAHTSSWLQPAGKEL